MNFIVAVSIFLNQIFSKTCQRVFIIKHSTPYGEIIMDNSQIENTINEIRKRSGAVTAFTFMIFVISFSIIPTFVFAAEEQSLEEEEVKSLGGLILEDFSHIKLYHIIEAIVVAFAIPFIYLKMQKYKKRKNVRKIWKSRLDILNTISLNSLNNSSATLQQIIFDLSKIEIQVAESFSELDYLAYAGRIQNFNELIGSIAPRNFILKELKKYLNGL